MKIRSKILFIYLSVALLLISCKDISTNPSSNLDVGSAKNYFALKTGNWWSYTTSALPTNQILYQFAKYVSRVTIGDSSRHQDGSLLYQYSLQVAARIPYTIIYYYAVSDSGVSIYYGIQDSIYYNGRWIPTRYPKVPVLLNSISVGHTWTVHNSSSQETFQIVSISQQIIAGITRPIVALVHLTSTNVDTSWYARDYGLVCTHSYVLGVTPIQGSTEILDSCFVH